MRLHRGKREILFFARAKKEVPDADATNKDKRLISCEFTPL
jgi:hypothetical protein